MNISSPILRKLFNVYLRCFSYQGPGGMFIGRRSRFECPVSIGRGTRLNGVTVARGVGAVFIGSYCAFGDDIRIITSNHDTGTINLQYALQRKIGLHAGHVDAKTVIIGNNVWVGDGVIIVPGATIGDGTVVGAGTVVSGDLSPFCVYAGNPAKLIRTRFTDETIRLLTELEWWKWDFSGLMNERDLFCARGSELENALKKALKSRKKEVH